MQKIIKPTCGRVVQYTDREGIVHAGTVNKFNENDKTIDFHYFRAGFSGPSAVAAETAPYDNDGGKHTVRYPVPEKTEIEI